ncbi:LuxR C-terminal-related transcriptional regulator [Acidipropionibacterium jensenii]|uniref:LuxR C-terminal-related transcriptional regulator n=1 Tax=Acidipropionibacterium jensenii TaxID=1749 RepID=UPI00214C7987|nr:response regulator transcription factor [Acidipropionibacterium jensenii]
MRIVIAEDQVLLRDGLARLLASAGHLVVAQVGDGPSLVAQVNLHRPEMVLADIRMPPSYTDEGARAVQLLRRRWPDLAVMMLSQLVDPDLVEQMRSRRLTRFGYLLKDRVLDTAVFLEQLETVAAGGTVIDQSAVDGYLRRDDGRLGQLTERETQVLRLVAMGRSNAGIAATLVISRRTVDAHLRAIFGKLGIAADGQDNQRVLAALDWLSG